MAIKVVGIVGSYRKGKTIDIAVSAILEGAKDKGAKVIKSLYFVPVAGREDSQLSGKALRKARNAGKELVRQIQADK